MEYAIGLLEKNRKHLERQLKRANLMQSDIHRAIQELHRVTELKRAIKILKQKQRKA